MSDKYLSISDFAFAVGVSQQSIYKRLKKDEDVLHKYVKIKDGKKVISNAAIEIYKNTPSPDFEVVEEEQADEAGNEIISILKEQIEYLKNEIDIKNKQIEDLTEQLIKSSDRETNYQTLLNQQQQLTATEKQKVFLLEDEKPKKKKGFFSLFGKRNKGEQQQDE